jgi:hypothetical protein
MSGPDTTLRIEIFDPATEPLVGGPVMVTRAESEPLHLYPAEFAWITMGRSRLAQWLAPTRRRCVWLERRGREIVQLLGNRRAQRTYDAGPRHDSSVRQHVFLPFGEVRHRLPVEETVIDAGSFSLAVTTPFEPTSRGGMRAPATLRLRWSWPALPVWITVEPWWRSRTIATVALRTTRRVRYPRRYFGAAHVAMREFNDLITELPRAAVGSGSACGSATRTVDPWKQMTTNDSPSAIGIRGPTPH